MKKTFFHRLFEVHNARDRRVVTSWASRGQHRSPGREAYGATWITGGGAYVV